MKNFIAISGMIIFISSIALGIYLKQGRSKALSKNKKETVNAIISDEILPCKWKAENPEPVMTENKSQSILVKVSNSNNEDCQSIISLRAPDFDFSPNSEDQNIKLTGNVNGSLSWIITPKKTG